MAPIPQNIPTPLQTPDTPLDTMEIDGHKYLLHQTIYHINQWHMAHLTAKPFCEHINNGLAPEHLKRDHSDDEDTPILSIPLQVTWNPTWVLEDTILATPSEKTAIDNYTQTKTPHARNREHHPPPIPHRNPKTSTLNTPLSPQDQSTQILTLHPPDHSKSPAIPTT